MGELTIAGVLWLLGQDEQLFRPRVGAMGVAVAAAALVDVVDSGAARWVDGGPEPMVESTDREPADPLVGAWASALGDSAGGRPLRVIHAIGAMGSRTWETVGADLVQQARAIAVPRRVRRWRPPRRRPDPTVADRERRHLRAVVHGAEPATVRDEGVLAIAWCAGVVEHVLSTTAFTDSGLLAPTRSHLEGSLLVDRLEHAVSYLVSMGPVIGITTPGWGASGSSGSSG